MFCNAFLDARLSPGVFAGEEKSLQFIFVQNAVIGLRESCGHRDQANTRRDVKFDFLKMDMHSVIGVPLQIREKNWVCFADPW